MSYIVAHAIAWLAQCKSDPMRFLLPGAPVLSGNGGLDAWSCLFSSSQVASWGRCRVFVGRVWPACGLVMLLGSVVLPLFFFGSFALLGVGMVLWGLVGWFSFVFGCGFRGLATVILSATVGQLRSPLGLAIAGDLRQFTIKPYQGHQKPWKKIIYKNRFFW